MGGISGARMERVSGVRKGGVSGVREETCISGKEGGEINVSVVRGDKGLFSLLYGISLLSYPGASVVRVWRATKPRHWQ